MKALIRRSLCGLLAALFLFSTTSPAQAGKTVLTAAEPRAAQTETKDACPVVEDSPSKDVGEAKDDGALKIQPMELSVKSIVAGATRDGEGRALFETICKDSAVPVSILVANPTDCHQRDVVLTLKNVGANQPFRYGKNAEGALVKTVPAKSSTLYTFYLVANENWSKDTFPLEYDLSIGEKSLLSDKKDVPVLTTKNIGKADEIPDALPLVEAIRTNTLKINENDNVMLQSLAQAFSEKSSESGNANGGKSMNPATKEIPNQQLPGGGGDFNVRTEDGGIPSVPSIIGGEGIKNKPKLIISNYSLTPKMPQAGQEFTMNLSFYNTNSKKSVNNIKIYITSDSSGTSATGAPTGGSVFSPVNSSNTFYIGKINPQKTVSKDITLSIMPNAQALNYTMNVHFEYEDADGNEFTAQELIGIPVVQEAKIFTGDVMVQDGISVGMGGQVDLDFYNTGKDSLSNFMVTVQGEGFTSETPRYFVGNFVPGSSDHFSTTIIPTEPGTLNGQVVISYEDSTGAPQVVEKPFSVTVMEEMPLTEGEMPPEEMPQPSPFSNPLLLGGIAVVAIIVIIVLLRRRKKKKEDEDLNIDE